MQRASESNAIFIESPDATPIDEGADATMPMEVPQHEGRMTRSDGHRKQRTQRKHRLGRHIKHGAKKSVGIIFVLAVVVGIWAAVVAMFHISKSIMPSPVAVASAFSGSFSAISSNAVPTAVSAVVGYTAAVVFGVPLGWSLSRPTRVQGVLNTGVLAAQIFPKIAVAPLLLVWLGFGADPKILYVMLLTFFPITINSAAGFLSVTSDTRDYLRMLHCGRMFAVRKVEVFAALPNIFTGMKISASFAVIAAIVFEFIGSSSGLGYLVLQSADSLQIPLMFASFIAITMIGFVFYGIISLVEAITIPWHISRRMLNPSSVMVG